MAYDRADWHSGTFGDYIADYTDALANDLPSACHVADTWDNFDRLEPVSQRYRSWRSTR